MWKRKCFSFPSSPLFIVVHTFQQFLCWIPKKTTQISSSFLSLLLPVFSSPSLPSTAAAAGAVLCCADDMLLPRRSETARISRLPFARNFSSLALVIVALWIEWKVFFPVFNRPSKAERVLGGCAMWKQLKSTRCWDFNIYKKSLLFTTQQTTLDVSKIIIYTIFGIIIKGNLRTHAFLIVFSWCNRLWLWRFSSTNNKTHTNDGIWFDDDSLNSQK